MTEMQCKVESGAVPATMLTRSASNQILVMTHRNHVRLCGDSTITFVW